MSRYKCGTFMNVCINMNECHVYIIIQNNYAYGRSKTEADVHVSSNSQLAKLVPSKVTFMLRVKCLILF